MNANTATEARNDVTVWFDTYKDAVPAESISQIGDAVEAAAIEGNWVRTFPDTDEMADVRALMEDIAPNLTVEDVLPSLIAAVVAQMGYRHSA